MDFWLGIENLINTGKVVIDRPKDSVHPRFPGLVYPIDYGYIEGATGGDGNALDLWRGSIPGSPLVGIVCTVDRIKHDAEIKILLGCSLPEVDKILHFYNKSEMMSSIVIHRIGGIRDNTLTI